MALRKVCVVTGARSEYYILRPVMSAIKASKALSLQTVVTGSHLLPEFGRTADEVESDGFHVDHRVDMVIAGDSLKAMAKSMGVGIIGLTDAFDSLRPDVVLLLGDRYEILSAAIAAAYSGHVIAHIHGGDSPRGGFDEYTRHAITKMSHLHFAATELSGRRIRQLGEDPERVYVVGSPAIDAILRDSPTPRRRLERTYDLGRDKPFILVVQHPISTMSDSAAAEIGTTLDALEGIGMQMVGIFPNADPGGERMRKRLASRAKSLDIRLWPNVPHNDYLGLMRACAVMVGNSSSGIIEAPTLGVPVVNIGDRQAGRERAGKVIDVPGDALAIARGMKKAMSPAYRRSFRRVINPYGDGHASERIVEVLKRVDLGRHLLSKRFHELEVGP